MVQYRPSIFNNIDHCSNHRFIQIKIWACFFSQDIFKKKPLPKASAKNINLIQKSNQAH